MAEYEFAHGKSIVKYDSDSGHFVWVRAYRKPSFTGRDATHQTTNGYLYIRIGGRQFSASRLAYSLVVGPVPDDLEIDHINRDRKDNRISNLRLVTRSGNMENREFRPNRCGATGVSLHKNGLYRARYKDRAKYFKSCEAAAEAYAEMKLTS
jgi:hypothetical protein